MKYLNCNISESVIKNNRDSEVEEINDPRYPLRFRYHKNRDCGSWFYIRGNKWKKIGQHPLVKFALVVKKLPEIEINLASGMDRDTATIGYFETVADLLRWHLERIQGLRDMSKRRKTGIKSIINRNLLPYIGEEYLCDVAAPRLDTVLMRPLQVKYSVSTIDTAFSVLKSAFKAAEKVNLIDVDPLASLRLGDFITTKPTPKPSRLAPKDLAAIYEALQNAPYKPRMLALFMMLYGTRIGETRRLRWDWFDMEAQTCAIPVDITKSKKKTHIIALTSSTVDLLNEYREEQERAGYRGVWLFSGSRKSALTEDQANRLIQKVSDREWTAHDLRKAFRDLLTMNGEEYITSERMLNHSLTTLDRTYSQSRHLDSARAIAQRAHEYIMKPKKAL